MVTNWHCCVCMGVGGGHFSCDLCTPCMIVETYEMGTFSWMGQYRCLPFRVSNMKNLKKVVKLISLKGSANCRDWEI